MIITMTIIIIVRRRQLILIISIIIINNVVIVVIVTVIVVIVVVIIIIVTVVVITIIIIIIVVVVVIVVVVIIIVIVVVLGSFDPPPLGFSRGSIGSCREDLRSVRWRKCSTCRLGEKHETVAGLFGLGTRESVRNLSSTIPYTTLLYYTMLRCIVTRYTSLGASSSEGIFRSGQTITPELEAYLSIII